MRGISNDVFRSHFFAAWKRDHRQNVYENIWTRIRRYSHPLIFERKFSIVLDESFRKKTHTCHVIRKSIRGKRVYVLGEYSVNRVLMSIHESMNDRTKCNRKKNDQRSMQNFLRFSIRTNTK